jgi:putative SOS response-associated peptidase YedK
MSRATFTDQALPFAGPESPRAHSFSERLKRRLFDKGRAPSAQSVAPAPTQLALPLGDEGEGGAFDAPSLFRAARRIEPVLSYEQPRIDEVIPDAQATAGAPRDRLVLPGGSGLVLYEGAGGTLAFDWMQWGEKAEPHSMRPIVDATIGVTDLLRGGRMHRKLAKRRCVIPLTRYSVPVRDGEIWSHLWVSVTGGGVACAAGIWVAEQGESARFAMVTGGPGVDPGPLLLPEDDLLLWLRAPLKDALGRLARLLARPS